MEEPDRIKPTHRIVTLEAVAVAVQEVMERLDLHSTVDLVELASCAHLTGNIMEAVEEGLEGQRQARED